MIELLKCTVKDIFRKKGRSLLTLLGIIIGVGSVVTIGNISQCGSTAIGEELDSLGLGSLAVGINLTTDATVILGENELEIIKKTNHVLDVTPIIIKNAKASNTKKSGEALIWGIDSKSNKIVSLKPIYGRCINKNDVKGSKNVCMIDQMFAKKIYGYEDIVGKKISVTTDNLTDEYKIIGVIQTGSGLLENVIGEYVPNFLYVPYTTVQSYTGAASFDQIAVKVDDSSNMDSVGNTIIKKLNLKVGRDGAYYANNLAKHRDGLTSILNIVTIILSSVGAVSLLVASLNIMTVMLVSVNERKREIGIKKSIGAKRITIMNEFLMEAIMLTLGGAFLGSLLGTGISFLGSFIFNIKCCIRLDVMIIATLLSLISGACFGIYPAIKASKLNPVEALRIE